MPHSLELLLYVSGNMVSLVLFNNRWASSGIGAGSLGKHNFCNQAVHMHACPLQPPLNANWLFNPVAHFDRTWQREKVTKMLPFYILHEKEWPGRGKKLGKSCAKEKVQHVIQLSLHIGNAHERNLQHASAEGKASNWALIILRHQTRK